MDGPILLDRFKGRRRNSRSNSTERCSHSGSRCHCSNSRRSGRSAQRSNSRGRRKQHTKNPLCFICSCSILRGGAPSYPQAGNSPPLLGEAKVGAVNRGRIRRSVVRSQVHGACVPMRAEADGAHSGRIHEGGGNR